MSKILQKSPIDLKSKFSAGIIAILVAALFYAILVIDNQVITIGGGAILAVIAFFVSKKQNFRVTFIQTLTTEKKLILIIGILFILLLPLTLRKQPYLMHILITSGISIILALGLNLQVGSTGIPNLGYAAFYGVGAYTSSILATRLGLPFWIVLLIAGVVAGFFAFLVALPTLKTRTYHLALVSIAFGLVTYIMLNNLEFTGGPNGIKNIPPPQIFGWSFLENLRIFGKPYPMQFNYYYLVVIVVAILGIVAHFLYQSRIGLYWNAIREDEIAAKCSGINIGSAKLLAFFIGGAFAGIAGSLYSHYIAYISPENFNMNISLLILAMVIMGGMDNVWGVAIGAVVLTLFPEKFRSLADFRMVASGLIIILMLMFRPTGIIKQQIRQYKNLFAAHTARPE